MKEKALITSFFIANLADASITTYALNTLPEFQEVGIAGSGLVEANQLDVAIITKMGITALLIGAYALAKNNENPRWTFVYENSLKYGHIIVWGITALNTAQVIHALVT